MKFIKIILCEVLIQGNSFRLNNYLLVALIISSDFHEKHEVVLESRKMLIDFWIQQRIKKKQLEES